MAGELRREEDGKYHSFRRWMDEASLYNLYQVGGGGSEWDSNGVRSVYPSKGQFALWHPFRAYLEKHMSCGIDESTKQKTKRLPSEIIREKKHGISHH